MSEFVLVILVTMGLGKDPSTYEIRVPKKTYKQCIEDSKTYKFPFEELHKVISNVGPLIGGALMLLLSMSSNIGADFQTVILPTTIYVMIGFVVVQLIDNFVNQPLIFSSSVKSHPLEIFLIIIIGGLLLGIVGMVVAVPAYTAIKVIAKEFLSEYKVVQKLTKNL